MHTVHVSRQLMHNVSVTLTHSLHTYRTVATGTIDCIIYICMYVNKSQKLTLTLQEHDHVHVYVCVHMYM
jgi:hypothetical protein